MSADVARRVARLDVIQAQQRMRQLHRLGEIDVDLPFRAHGLGAGQLRQALHARLRLLGLARLRLEAVDERLQMRALDLFLLERDLLQMQLLGALMLEARVVAGVELRAAFVQMQNVRRHAIEELAVVRDHHQHAGIFQKPLLEPEHRIEIEMVGRLVEQQQVRRHHQRAREIEPHAPAAGEIRDRHAMRLGPEAEPVQQPAGARLGVVAVDVGHLLVRERRRASQSSAAVAAASALRIASTSVSPETTKSIAASASDGVSCATLAMRTRVGRSRSPWSGLDLALDRREQARLAAAVAADHADARAGVQREVDVGQQQAFAAPKGEVPERDHGSTGTCRSQRL